MNRGSIPTGLLAGPQLQANDPAWSTLRYQLTAMGEARKNKFWSTNLAVLLALFSGLGANVFMYWWEHRPTTIAYNVTTTTLGGVKGLLPDLKIKIGADEVETVHIYTVDFISQSSPFLDRATPLIAFGSAHFLGQLVTVDPSPIQHIFCRTSGPNIQCSLGPLKGAGERFRVSFASPEQRTPMVYLAAKNVELTPLKVGSPTDWTLAVVIVGQVLGVFVVTLNLLSVRRQMREVHTIRQDIKNLRELRKKLDELMTDPDQ